MKLLKNPVVFLLLSCLLFTGCPMGYSGAVDYQQEIYSPACAEGFSIYSTEGLSTVLSVRNPWQGAQNTSSELFLARNQESAPDGFRGESVRLPLRRVVTLSASYIAFMDAIGETDAVVGVSGAPYISNPKVRQRIESGVVKDVGYDALVDYETLAGLRPDLVLIYGVGGENTAVTSKLADMGIPVMYVGDYLEQSPLGKAEWVVFFGEMFDKREKAVSLFDHISAEYRRYKLMAESHYGEKPKVILNAPYRDVWFVPGDSNYMVRLIEDAGGEYIFRGDDSSVTRPISGEEAFVAARRADVWLNPNQARTLADLKTQNPKFASVPAVRSGRVYNSTKRSTPSGGSDFWESGSLRADLVLRDILICLHPELVSDLPETYYFEQLK